MGQGRKEGAQPGSALTGSGQASEVSQFSPFFLARGQRQRKTRCRPGMIPNAVSREAEGGLVRPDFASTSSFLVAAGHLWASCSLLASCSSSPWHLRVDFLGYEYRVFRPSPHVLLPLETSTPPITVSSELHTFGSHLTYSCGKLTQVNEFFESHVLM